MPTLIKVLVLAAQCTLIFGLWQEHGPLLGYHLGLDEYDERLWSVKVDNKFYTQPLKINKKPKYVRNTFGGKLKSSLTSGDKKCCGNEWDLFQPAYVPEDVKPVTEDIVDDFKYDFRTKMHSF